ncbi:uncharacterized protein LAJ45_00524 [Morchella importuna]|uniref:uncharacterized protein n=1 Tax=Morchella importuna TaxID=1174673 RepID=UPI001E8D4B1D|nr:uncharacterized protein LAJ45_00524 [Morchella importuna]KAH8155514.1 hypothetical protein LAJ45_00524 [Morchella importuna]
MSQCVCDSGVEIISLLSARFFTRTRQRQRDVAVENICVRRIHISSSATLMVKVYRLRRLQLQLSRSSKQV